MALRRKRRLQETYEQQGGFKPGSTVQGIFGRPRARVIQLTRRRKKRRVASVDNGINRITTSGLGAFGIWAVATPMWIWR
jgi:hypothetical protein